jgi:hypothetical protein
MTLVPCVMARSEATKPSLAVHNPHREFILPISFLPRRHQSNRRLFFQQQKEDSSPLDKLRLTISLPLSAASGFFARACSDVIPVRPSLSRLGLRWVTACADRRLAAIFATLVVAGAPAALTAQLALLAFVNRKPVGRFVPRPPVIRILPILRIIPILPIRGRFKGCNRRDLSCQLQGACGGDDLASRLALVGGFELEYFDHTRCPAQIISHGVWLYFRFCLRYRDVEELIAECDATASSPMSPGRR